MFILGVVGEIESLCNMVIILDGIDYRMVLTL